MTQAARAACAPCSKFAVLEVAGFMHAARLPQCRMRNGLIACGCLLNIIRKGKT
jgi:hypothetical protein